MKTIHSSLIFSLIIFFHVPSYLFLLYPRFTEDGKGLLSKVCKSMQEKIVTNMGEGFISDIFNTHIIHL